MTAFWNKTLVELIAKQLAHLAILKVNNYFFINVDATDDDPCIQDLVPLTESCGGAAAILLNRSYLVDTAKQVNSHIANVMLEQSFEEEATLRIVVLTSRLFAEKHQDRLLFVMAHEIGHHHLGHTAVDFHAEFGSKEYNAREVEADEFAAKILGSNDERRSCLSYMNEQAQQRIAEAPPEMVAKIMAMLEARINWE